MISTIFGRDKTLAGTVTLDVTNTGAVAGREVVQLYTSLPGSSVQRPPRELKAFASVDLQAGETRSVTLTVRAHDLAYWDVRVDHWVVEGGAYTVEVGASSRDWTGSAGTSPLGPAPGGGCRSVEWDHRGTW